MLESRWLEAGCKRRVSDLKHGHLNEWLHAFEQLPAITPDFVGLEDVVTVAASPSKEDTAALHRVVELLIPWRKGPFSLMGIQIDSEWRSNMKWARIENNIDLNGKSILDVGSGNGYYGWRMLEAGASSVTGVESTLPYVFQAALIANYIELPNTVIPCRYGEELWLHRYDVVFSMGVLYHQRDMVKHVNDLHENLKRNGALVLETLVADETFIPERRYARMRNVWTVPSVDDVKQLLARAGFKHVALIDRCRTTRFEQRSTKYMPFESLQDALDPNDHRRTVEGYPAPERAMFVGYC